MQLGLDTEYFNYHSLGSGSTIMDLLLTMLTHVKKDEILEWIAFEVLCQYIMYAI